MYVCMAMREREATSTAQHRGKSESIHTSRRAENNNNKIHENTQISSNALGVGT